MFVGIYICVLKKAEIMAAYKLRKICNYIQAVNDFSKNVSR
jgi:hypothetical protein